MLIVGADRRQGFWRLDNSDGRRAAARAALRLRPGSPLVLVVGGGEVCILQ